MEYQKLMDENNRDIMMAFHNKEQKTLPLKQQVHFFDSFFNLLLLIIFFFVIKIEAHRLSLTAVVTSIKSETERKKIVEKQIADVINDYTSKNNAG